MDDLAYDEMALAKAKRRFDGHESRLRVKRTTDQPQPTRIYYNVQVPRFDGDGTWIRIGGVSITKFDKEFKL